MTEGMNVCRRCGEDCTGEDIFCNTIYNPWNNINEGFWLCRRCQNIYAHRTVQFINEYPQGPYGGKKE